MIKNIIRWLIKVGWKGATVVVGLLLAGLGAVKARTTIGKHSGSGDNNTSHPTTAQELAACAPAIAPYADTIVTRAPRFGVGYALAAAIILTESGGNPRAVRYEPAIARLVTQEGSRWDAARRLGWTTRLLASSLGLGQVLGTTAWDLGAHYPPERMFEPYLNISLMAKDMGRQLDMYGGVLEALLAYNGGSGAVRAYKAGHPYNLAYANKVMKLSDSIRKCMS